MESGRSQWRSAQDVDSLGAEEALLLEEAIRSHASLSFQRDDGQTIHIWGFAHSDGSVVCNPDISAPGRIALLSEREQVRLYHLVQQALRGGEQDNSPSA
jgi:hypothetical protein